MTFSTQGRWFRTVSRGAVLAVLTATAVVPALAVIQGRAAAAGNPLVADSFRNASAADPAFVVLGSNFTPCLTASTTTVAGSSIQACAAGAQAVPTGGDGNGAGALRLTDAGTQEAGALLYNKALPLTEGAQISFDFAMYGGINNLHADGISFFVADGRTNLTQTGANGGSLGYAQKVGTGAADAPGVAGGFLGLGLDEYGNYELDTEGRGSSPSGTYTCTNPNSGRVTNQVGLRGPGMGNDGYCLLGSSPLSTTTQTLYGPGPTRTAGLDSAQITVDPPGPNAKVTVGLAFGVTGAARNYAQVLSVPEPANAPATFKFGLASSTGAKTDIHEIQNLTVNTVTTRPVLTITQSDTSAGIVDAGSTATLTLDPAVGTAADETLAPTITDALPTGLTVAAIPTVTGYDCSATQVGSGTLSCTWNGTLPLAAGGALPEIPLSVAVAGGTSGTLSSAATISSVDAATATAPHDVTAVAPPVAVADSVGTVTDGTLAIHELANDTGTGSLTPVVTTNPAHGQLTLQSDGSYRYQPTTGYSGPDSFAYTVSDARGVVSAPATVSITVVPKAVPQSFTGIAGQPLSVPAPGALTGDDGTATLTASLTAGAGPSRGSVTVKPDGSFLYTPTTAYSGTDTFGYTVTDPSGTAATSTVTITLSPAAAGGQQTVADGSSLPAGTAVPAAVGTGPFRYTLLTGPQHASGTFTLTSTGTFAYTPTTPFSGTDTFTYTATDASGVTTPTATETIHVTPVAANDAYTTTAGTAISETAAQGVLANDLGSALRAGPTGATIATAGGGTAVLAADGSLTYTPAAGFSGTDSFRYTLTDGSGQTTGAQVSVTVRPVVASATTSVADGSSLPAGTALPTPTGAGPFTYTVVSAPAHAATGGFALGTGSATGTFRYTPATPYSGTDTVTYTVTDSAGQTSAPATETITIIPTGVPDATTTPFETATPALAVVGNDDAQAPTVTGITQPTHGSAVLGNGTVVYTPAAGFTGTDTFSYQAQDSHGAAYGPTTVTVTVSPPAAPTAVTHSESTAAGTAVAPPNETNLLSGDTGTRLVPSVTAGAGPAHGTVTLSSTTPGDYTYTPAAGFSGTDGFGYTVTDAAGQHASSTVTIRVTPVAISDSVTTGFQTGYTAAGSTLTGNDDGTGLTLTAVSAPGSGSTVLHADGTFTYTPVAGFAGTTAFTYTATDSSGQRETGTVTVTVMPALPVAHADTGATTSGITLTDGTNLLANDTGAGPLTAGGAAAPSHGTASVATDGSYVYTPAAGFSGVDSFTYVVTDSAGQTSAPGTVTITVAPQSHGDSRAVPAGQTLSATVPTPTGTGPFSYAAATGPAHGTLTVNADGTYAYRPVAGYLGADSFTYLATGNGGVASAPATISISVVDPATPVAADDGGTTPAGVALTNGSNLLQNDMGTGPLTATRAGGPSHGSVTVSSDGTYAYTPAAGYSGPDTFTYTATDVVGQVSAPATVRLAVVPVAAADTYAVTGGTALVIAAPGLLGNDVGTGLSVTSHTDPAHGTVVVAPGGSLTYTPATGYAGADSFTYVVTDTSSQQSPAGTVTLNVGPPAVPVAADDTGTTPAGAVLTSSSLLTNDRGAGPLTPAVVSAPAHGTVSLAADGTYTYTPTAGYSGPDSFTYRVTDPYGQRSAPATVTLTVTPSTRPDSATLTGGSAYAGTSVLTNDDGTGLSAVTVTPPAHGTLVLAADGSYTYTPASGYAGTDAFTYRAKDSSGGLSPATTVTLDVVKPAAPVGRADADATSADATGSSGADLLDNDSGSAPLTTALDTPPSHGTVTVRSDGTYDYVPAAGFSGTDTFTYLLTDGYGQASAPVTVTVTVSATAAPASVSVVGGSSTTRTLPTPVGTGPFTDAVGTGPAHGTVTVAPGGSYTYTPTPGYVGTDSFTYTVGGPGGTSSPATVSITVTQPPAPTGMPQAGATAAGSPLHGTGLLTGVTGSGPFTTVLASDPAHGTATVTPGGTYTYAPAPGFSGVDSFTYLVDDGYGNASAPVTVTVTVTPTAVGDTGTVPEDHTLTGAGLLANDRGVGLTAVLVSGPAHGVLTLNADGTYLYTPTPGYAGPDSFSYEARGAGGSSTPAVVTLTVVGTVPVVTGGTHQTTTVGGTLAPITFTTPGGGMVTTAAPGSLPPGITLLPTGAFAGAPTTPGTYTFPVTVTDSAGGTTTVLATITVAGLRRALPVPPASPAPRPAPASPQAPPPGSPSGGLPFTGAPVEDLLGWAVAMTAGGALSLGAGRRRRRWAHRRR